MGCGLIHYAIYSVFVKSSHMLVARSRCTFHRLAPELAGFNIRIHGGKTHDELR